MHESNLRTHRQVHVARWVHDSGCAVDGERQRGVGKLVRPPSNTSMLVHHLKTGGWRYAWAAMSDEAGTPYDHSACVSDEKALVRGLKNARRRWAQAASAAGGSKDDYAVLAADMAAVRRRARRRGNGDARDPDRGATPLKTAAARLKGSRARLVHG